jgi:hypothetical protein
VAEVQYKKYNSYIDVMLIPVLHPHTWSQASPIQDQFVPNFLFAFHIKCINIILNLNNRSKMKCLFIKVLPHLDTRLSPALTAGYY